MSRDDHDVELNEPWQPKRRQNVIKYDQAVKFAYACATSCTSDSCMEGVDPGWTSDAGPNSAGWKGWTQVELVMLGPIQLQWSCWKCPFLAGTEQKPLRFWHVSLSLHRMCNPTHIILLQSVPVQSELQHCILGLFHTGTWTLTVFVSCFDSWLHPFGRFDRWPLTDCSHSCNYRVYESDTPLIHMLTVCVIWFWFC